MNIEIVNASVIAEGTMEPKILAYFIDKDNRKFYEFNQFVSHEFIQDVSAGSLIVEDVLNDNIKDCVQVTPEYMVEHFSENEEIKKYILPYIREKKIDSIIK